MGVFLFKKISKIFIVAFFCFGCLISKTYADTTFFPQPLATPVYEYNSAQGILAIPSESAESYETTFLSINDTDKEKYIVENNGNNIFNNVINDSDAILGYTWSERVGWISFSHGIIQDFTKYYPRFAKDLDGSQEILKGYLWNEQSGWIRLSSNNFETSNAQNDNNWGVILNGNSFSGKAWGAALGWIDFSNVTYDSTTGKFGGYACSNNDKDSNNDQVCDDSAKNKIYFDKVPDGITSNTGKLTDWGVSKNMTTIEDTLYPGTINETICNLLSDDTCSMNSPKTALSVNTDGSEITVNFEHRLTLNGNHDLRGKITNKYGETLTYVNPTTTNDSLRIKSVVWPMNCSLDGNGIFICDAPDLNLSTSNNGAVADGEDTITLTAKLTNSASEAIYIDPLNNVFDLSMSLVFEDTVETNQLDLGTSYDAVSYLDTINNFAYSSESSTNTLNLINNNSNGEFKVDINSFAPTNATNNLVLKDFEITIILDNDAPAASRIFTFNKTNDYSSQENINLTFSPALTATITNFEHLIENTSSVFSVILENHSPTQSIAQINLNTLFDGILANLIAEIKAKSDSAYSNVFIDQLQLVSNDFSEFDYLMVAENPANQSVSSDTKILLDQLNQNSTQSLTFDLKPILVLGDQIDINEAIDFSTEIAYDIEGSNKITLHKSHSLDLQKNLLTSQVDVKGLASGDKIYDINKDYSINTSGDSATLREISEQIRKNVSDLTRNETAGTLNTTITNWTTGNQINNSKTLYYKGEGDLVIGDGNNDFEINDEQGSIIVVGGDVYLKSNIIYSEQEKGSFGLIVIQDENGNGGNIYIDPAITNLVGGYYSEGTMVSALDTDNNDNISDDEIFDGFSTNRNLLVNQLFVQGTLISKNTIGGSRQNPIEFPEGYDSSSCSSGSDEQKCAERFDLNYLRNFAVNSSGSILNGGRRADGTDGTTNAETDSNSAFVIKYDSRIQTNIPPGFEINTEMNFEEIVL